MFTEENNNKNNSFKIENKLPLSNFKNNLKEFLINNNVFDYDKFKCFLVKFSINQIINKLSNISNEEKKIYFKRHALAEHNLLSYQISNLFFCNSAIIIDPDIVDKDYYKRKNIRSKISKLKLDAIYCSPLKRCINTAIINCSKYLDSINIQEDSNKKVISKNKLKKVLINNNNNSIKINDNNLSKKNKTIKGIDNNNNIKEDDSDNNSIDNKICIISDYKLKITIIPQLREIQDKHSDIGTPINDLKYHYLNNKYLDFSFISKEYWWNYYPDNEINSNDDLKYLLIREQKSLVELRMYAVFMYLLFNNKKNILVVSHSKTYRYISNSIIPYIANDEIKLLCIDSIKSKLMSFLKKFC